jgi:hypothetical protein
MSRYTHQSFNFWVDFTAFKEFMANFIGSIEVNLNDCSSLFQAILNEFSGDQTRLAIWLVTEFDLSPINFQYIGEKSPFSGSDGVLAGTGVLIELEPEKADQLIEVLTISERLEYEILHIQIECQGMVQFASYDRFSHIFFGNAVSLAMLEDLKTRGVVYSYQLCDDATTG